MRRVLCLVFGFIVYPALAQVQYESGYFIDNDNNRIECLIRNEGWFRNPVEFEYKLNVSDQRLEAGVESVREFGVSGLKYLRQTVEVDTSSQNLQKLSRNSAPEWGTQTIFLQQLVDGPAKLYRYRTRELQLFFYSVGSSETEQLVYKRYSVNATQVSENLMFRSQLRGNLACDDKARAAMNRVSYQADDLAEIFIAYNECKGFKREVTAKSGSSTKSKISLWITPGFDFANIAQVSDAGFFDTSPQPDPGYRIGVMGEFGLAFQRNKWSLIAEPTFQSSTSTTREQFHRSVELPLGVRHNFFLGGDMALFVDAMMVVDFFLNYRCKNDYGAYPPTRYPDKFAGCAAVGGGFRWHRFSLETRHYFNRRLRSENLQHLVDYSKTSIVLGLRVF